MVMWPIWPWLSLTPGPFRPGIGTSMTTSRSRPWPTFGPSSVSVRTRRSWRCVPGVELRFWTTWPIFIFFPIMPGFFWLLSFGIRRSFCFVTRTFRFNLISAVTRLLARWCSDWIPIRFWTWKRAIWSSLWFPAFLMLRNNGSILISLPNMGRNRTFKAWVYFLLRVFLFESFFRGTINDRVIDRLLQWGFSFNLGWKSNFVWLRWDNRLWNLCWGGADNGLILNNSSADNLFLKMHLSKNRFWVEREGYWGGCCRGLPNCWSICIHIIGFITLSC